MQTKKILAASLMGVAVLVSSGCASTRTQESAGEYLDDSALTAKVKMALANDPATKARDINVETFRNIVQLSGFVDNEAEAQRAISIAQNTPGVRSVKNDMRIKFKS